MAKSLRASMRARSVPFKIALLVCASFNSSNKHILHMSDEHEQQQDGAADAAAEHPASGEQAFPSELDEKTQLAQSESEPESETKQERLTHSRSERNYPYYNADSPLPSEAAAAPSPADPPPVLDLSAVGVWRSTLQAIRTNPSLMLNSGSARMSLFGVFLGIVFGIGSQWALFAFLLLSLSQKNLRPLPLLRVPTVSEKTNLFRTKTVV